MTPKEKKFAKERALKRWVSMDRAAETECNKKKLDAYSKYLADLAEIEAHQTQKGE